MRQIARSLFGCFALAWGSLAVAYPSYIGYRHTSCTSCHFNGQGGGLLTDYGRALKASLIAAKPYWAPDADDEDLAKSAGLLGPLQLPRWVRAQANAQASWDVQDLDAKSDASAGLDRADLTLAFVPSSVVWFVANGGYHPRVEKTEYPGAPWISREHYVAIEFHRTFRVYTGLTDVVYGMRIPETFPFSRTWTELGSYSQVHAVTGHFATANWDVIAQGSLGNLMFLPAERMRGGSTLVERELNEFLRVGASVYYAQNRYKNRYMGSVHVRAGVGDGSSVLTELGGIKDREFGAEADHLKTYFLLQTTTRFARGFHFVLTSEFATENPLGPATRVFRLAPGLRYDPFARLGFKVDVQATRSIAGPKVGHDGLDFYTQVFLWF